MGLPRRTSRGLLAAAAACAALHWARPCEAGKPKLSGVVRGGYEVLDRIGPQAEAELRLKTGRVHGTRAVAKIEARYFREGVDLERAYVEHRVLKGLEFRMGLDKKRLGLEYEQGNQERMTTTRSLIYQEMEELGLVGRQLSVRAATEPIVDEVFVDLTVGLDGSHNANVILRATREPGDFGYGTWALFERRRVDKGYDFAWVQALSAWYISSDLRLVAELLGGIDPVRTELEAIFSAPRTVFFFGPKVEAAVRVDVSDWLAVEPMLQASMLWHDLQDTRIHSIGGVAGCNLYLWDMMVALEAHLLGERQLESPQQHQLDGERFLVQWRYYY